MSIFSGNLLFELFGNSDRTFIQKIKKEFPFYIAFYTDGVSICIENEKTDIPIDKIKDVYIVYKAATGNNNLGVKFEYYKPDGTDGWYTVYCGKFPTLIDKVEELINSGWGNIKPLTNPTVNWINSAGAIFKLYKKENPNVYGFRVIDQSVIKQHIDILRDSWDVKTKGELLETLDSLYWRYEDRAHLVDSMIKAMCAWDLQRLINVSVFGYEANYLTYEESLEWSFNAAEKIQLYFDSWSDFLEAYCLGCAVWEEVPLNNPEGLGYKRLQIYLEVKDRKNSPFNIPWKTALRKNW